MQQVSRLYGYLRLRLSSSSSSFSPSFLLSPSFHSLFWFLRGDWMSDRLTIAEKLAYDRAMGYVTINTSGNGGSSSRRSSRRSSRKASSSSLSSPRGNSLSVQNGVY